jgi:hypothetical protein
MYFMTLKRKTSGVFESSRQGRQSLRRPMNGESQMQISVLQPGFNQSTNALSFAHATVFQILSDPRPDSAGTANRVVVGLPSALVAD